ncbi:MAG: glutamyl-tRNA reductase [Thermomicrobiales bacterium]|nr:glutamyl-tRNA reductase [Thermomicrobiales bacterium]
MRLWMLGTNHERASIEVRERLAFGNDNLGDGVRQLGAVAHEGVILSTCNRTEIYGLFDSDTDGGEELRQFLVGSRDLPATTVAATTYLHADNEAVRHLYRVSCGLDSMLLGEPQILTQVQDALATARETAAAGPVLTRLYTDALRVGKAARTSTGIARNRLSIAHAAIDLATRELGSLAGQRVIVLGAGEIGTIAARVLRTANTADLVIVNRTPSRGQALAAAVEGRYVALSDLPDELTDAAVVFSAVSTPDFVLGQDVLPPLKDRRGAPLLIVDLGVPRTIDPALADDPVVRLRTVDDLEQIADSTRRSYDSEIVRVERLIDQAVDHFDEWLGTRQIVPTIRALQDRAEQIREAEVERALRRLGHLSERDREVVRALSVGIVGKMLHQPIVTLRTAAANGHHESAARAAAEFFDLPRPSDTHAD